MSDGQFWFYFAMFAFFPIWISAKLIGVNRSGIIPCIISFVCSIGLTLIVRLYITQSVELTALICLPLMAVINLFAFKTTFLKGALITIASALILAFIVSLLNFLHARYGLF